MVDFNYYLNTDYFKIGKFGQKHVKNINIALLVCVTVIVFTLIFNIIAFSSSNYHSLGEISDIQETYEEKIEPVFGSYNIALKIMPSYNTRGNAIFMNRETDYTKTQIDESASLQSSYDFTNTFFVFQNTRDFFPTLEYRQDAIPVGNSISMCLHVYWGSQDKGQNLKLMSDVEGFPVCEATKTGKFIWNVDDTNTGLDIPVWKQYEYDIDCADEIDCQESCAYYYKALYVEGRLHKKCYAYEILDKICFTIQKQDATDDYIYSGGCYEDGKAYKMKVADPDADYEFNDVRIEVRNGKDPVIMAGKISNYSYSYGTTFAWLGAILFLLFVLSVFTLLGIAAVIFYYRSKDTNNKTLLKNDEDKNQSKEMKNIDDDGQI